jgi:hypothetical protein
MSDAFVGLLLIIRKCTVQNAKTNNICLSLKLFTTCNNSVMSSEIYLSFQKSLSQPEVSSGGTLFFFGYVSKLLRSVGPLI